ncbi:MAG: hypothetical protein Kow0047_05230 [Anaerolineae bacterium]
MKLAPTPHDLRLPDWGPYTKRYVGISHIPDVRAGLRFDLSVFPGFYRRRVDVPSVLWESGYHPWEASSDLRYFSFRHELQWKDEVYCDIAYAAVSEHSYVIRCECVNRTDAPQNLVLHYMASMNFPPLRTNSPEALRPARVILPAGARWADALDYAEMRFATPRPTDHLVYDGWWRGEIRDHGFVDGRGLGRGFGADAGDTVTYRLVLDEPLPDATLVIRYRTPDGRPVPLRAVGLIDGEITLPAGDGFLLHRLSLGDLAPGDHALTLTALGGAVVDLDGLALLPGGTIDQLRFEEVQWRPVPEMRPGPGGRGLLLRYPDVDLTYGLAWDYDLFQVREFYTDELDRFMRYTVHNHVATVLRGQGEGHFVNVFMRPIPLAPRSSRALYGLVCAGDEARVTAELGSFHDGRLDPEVIYREARERRIRFEPSAEGRQYLFSQERMAATLATNVVYPVYTRRTYIRHNTPGRWWDSLYTWDSGFIGLGLLELDLERAIDCLNAYVTPPGDDHAAFIHHGSPVPVQIYLFQELWNRTQRKDLLEYFYPRLKQYHWFLAGRAGGSTTRALKSNLLKTWDYFYNSGGWDDYPPQVHVHRHGLQRSVTPVVTTAQVIRTAKILSLAAEALGLTEDVAEYQDDIEVLTRALQEHAWDEESGYFGYVCHDEDGRPTGILRHESGANFNMGLDGAYPLVSGVCSDEQIARLLPRFESEAHLWTPIGISTVDQSAPYYRVDGYWNGAVWMAHQWFFWKTFLDLGRIDLAWRVARTALDVWQREVAESYHCFEHFIIESGRGAGWHQFGGLSAPVVSWFAAHYIPGRLTTGLNAWVVDHAFHEGGRRLTARLRLRGRSSDRPCVVATMQPGGSYRATWDGEPCAVQQPTDGCVAVTLPTGAGEGVLLVQEAR